MPDSQPNIPPGSMHVLLGSRTLFVLAPSTMQHWTAVDPETGERRRLGRRHVLVHGLDVTDPVRLASAIWEHGSREAA